MAVAVSPPLAAGASVFVALMVTHRVLASARRAGVVGGSGPSPWRAPVALGPALDAAAVPWPAELVWEVWCLAGVGTVLIGLVAGPGAFAVTALAVGGGPVVALAANRDRARRLVDAALPDAVDGVARSLRSGATLAGALAETAGTISGRLGDDLRLVVADVDGGVPLAVALDAWPDRCPTPGVRLAATAFVLSAEAGGSAARAVDGVAATLRSNLAVAGEVRAQSSQARLSGMVIALAPLAFGALAAGTDRRTASFLLRTPFGLACLTAGLALDAAAAWWMHRITRAAS